MKRLLLFISALSLILTVISCSPERKLAKSFVEQDHDLSFLIMSPEYLYKVNLKKYELDSTDTTQESVKDSVLLAKSLFLKYISDTTFLNRYTGSLQSQLEKYGLKVYPEARFDSLLQARSNAFIVNIAQFSIEEYVHPYTSDQVIGNEVMTIKDIDLNALNFNTWVELSRMNSDTGRVVLFSSDQLFDGINGYFKQYLFNPEVSFEYSIDTITLDQIYQKAAALGRKDGAYLFDYMMNKYLKSNLPANYPYEPLYFHYDPESRSLRPIDPENSFIQMKDNN